MEAKSRNLDPGLPTLGHRDARDLFFWDLGLSFEVGGGTLGTQWREVVQPRWRPGPKVADFWSHFGSHFGAFFEVFAEGWKRCFLLILLCIIVIFRVPGEANLTSSGRSFFRVHPRPPGHSRGFDSARI